MRALPDVACRANVDCVKRARIEAPAHRDGGGVSPFEGDGESSDVTDGP